MEIVQSLEEKELDFLSESKETRNIIEELEKLDGKGGVMVKFDSEHQKTSISTRVRNYYNGAVSVKKVDYGNTESLKYILYFNEQSVHDYRGQDGATSSTSE